MIKRTHNILFLVTVIILLASCERLIMEPDPENTATENFEQLWNNLDRKYSFFELKRVNWDSIYKVYRPMINNDMHDTVLFNTLGKMILELKDAHTDIWGPHGHIYYDYTAGSWENYNSIIQTATYLGLHPPEVDGIYYNTIDSIAYLFIPSFSGEISKNGIRKVLEDLSGVKGYIIDVRQNDGGNDRNGRNIINHFLDKKRLVEINYYKTGPGHNDFEPIKLYLEPKNGLMITKPTVLLTNRRCYSACNSFVCWMTTLPHVLHVGDTTGGGGGTPHFSELPGGLTYRYSSNQSFRPDGLNTEPGIPPDTTVFLNYYDVLKNLDTLIEYALAYIKKNS